MAETLSGFLRSIDGLDVTVAIEFNWGPMVKSFQSAVRICELADHPRAGVLFDPAHYHCTPTKLEHLTPEAARWIKHVHLNDMRPIPGDLSDCNADRVLPGEGIIPLRGPDRRDRGGRLHRLLLDRDVQRRPVGDARRPGRQTLLRELVALCALASR